MKYIPQWTPNDGVGKGVPNYDNPAAVLTMSAIGSTMQVTFLGRPYQLTKNPSNPLLYQDANSGLSICLSSTPLNDPNVQENLQATLSLPSAGIANSVFDCDETGATTNAFSDATPGVVASITSLNPDAADSMTLTLYTESSTTDFQLTETGNNTQIFTGGGLTVQLVNNPSLGGTLDMELTYAPANLSNAVVRVTRSGGQYRNFAPPTSTDLPRQPVDDAAAFYIQIPMNLGTVTLTTKVDGQDQEIAEINLVDAGNGKWRSEKKLVLCSEDDDTSQMTSGDTNDFQVITWPDDADTDWTDGGGQITVNIQGGSGQTSAMRAQKSLNVAAPMAAQAGSPATGTVQINAQAPGIVLQSLAWIYKAGQNLDPENRIRKPFQQMGYTMYRDYDAPRNRTVNDYVKGKQIWYSMSHGGTEGGTPHGDFQGLIFKDGNIRASDLQPLGLNYRLVIADGCCSAQTSTISIEDAQDSNTLLDSAKEFADAFGENAAYIGWSWEQFGIGGTQAWTGAFVSQLKGNRTVQDAYDAFQTAHLGDSHAKEIKIYGHGENKIDLKATGGKVE